MGNTIIGTGIALGKNIIPNEKLPNYLDLNDFDEERAGMSFPEFVAQKTGFLERRISDKDEKASDYMKMAAEDALEDAGLKSEDIGLIVTSTATPDDNQPNNAHKLQEDLGAMNHSHVIGLIEGCPGFNKSLHIADALMDKHSEYEYSLIVCGDLMSKIVGTHNCITGMTFGDGYGAFVLKKSDKILNSYGILSSYGKSDGERGKFLHVPIGGLLEMNNKGIKEFAIQKFDEATRSVLRREGIPINDIKYIIAHQASGHFIKNGCELLGILMDGRVLTNYERYSNTSQASTMILYHENKKKFKNGDIQIFTVFGAGLSWGSIAYRFFDYAQVPKEVAIVDDYPREAESLVDALKKHTKRDPSFETEVNYSVFESGESFVEAIHENPAKFHVAIVDQRMPGLSGLESTMQAKKIQKDIICAILTGQSEEEDYRNMVNYGGIATVMFKDFFDRRFDGDRFEHPNYLTFKNMLQKPYLFH